MALKNDGGKGSKARPKSVAQDEYDKRWDAIFARDVPPENVMQMPGTVGSATVVLASQTENERLELYKKL